jgi:hypothetical protein
MSLKKELYTPKYEIFCDVDAVLADFDSRFKFFTGQLPTDYEKEHGTKKFWSIITKIGEKFWSEIDWMPEGKKLWEFIAPFNPKLLTAPSSHPSSRIGKQQWRDKHLPGVEMILASRANKQNYAGYNKILIDDNKTSIMEWKANSGIGIFFVTTDQAINELEMLGL